MNNLAQQIQAFNSVVTASWNQIRTAVPATAEELRELEPHFALGVPPQLKLLYEAFGGLHTDGNEDFAVSIDTPRTLLDNLCKEGFYWKLHSLGLVDTIRFSWVNDRPEFGQVDPGKVALINERYKGFGFYRRDDGLEEAHYLYFDAHGKFGAVRYHQDDFSDLWDDQLNPMLQASRATEDLPALLERVLREQQALWLSKQG